MDWDTLLFAPVNAILGVDAVIVLACGDPPVTIRAIDMTGGASTGRDVQMDTIRPAADVRAVELAAKGLDVERLVDATLTMNGKDWTVKSFLPMPAPNGEGQGEYRLVLEEA